MSTKKRRLGKILVKKGKITPEQLEEGLKYAEEHGCRLGEALVKLGHVDTETIAKTIARQNSLPYVNLSKTSPPESLLNLIPQEVAQKYLIVPVKKKSRRLIVASAEPLDFVVLDELRWQINGVDSVECAIASREAIIRIISGHFGLSEEMLDKELEELDGELQEGHLFDEEEEEDAFATEDDAPVIRLVNLLITEAIKKRASDIHIEPMEKKLQVRYRIDGICVPQESPPKKLQGPIISRIKIMAQMDMTERRRPQDGRIKMKIEGREIDFRVNSLPATHGESVVLRVLDKEKALVDLEELGMHENEYNTFMQLIKRPNGIVLVTGPTGSGKTTTLYAALKKLNRPDVKIITAENPVEFSIPGINQAEVKHNINLTFARILKAMLRQAPNIILVGEIRDLETAETAVQAALTGHLVFSTLHTNDAPSAISRLIDMEVKPFLVASAVIGVLAQRLVRMLCPHCKQPYEPSARELMSVNLTPDDIMDAQIYQAVGCEKCEHQGYRGRRGVYELMKVDPDMRDMIFDGATTEQIRAHAIKNGMVTLQQDAIRKVLSGLTTIEEVLRLTHRADLTLSY